MPSPFSTSSTVVYIDGVLRVHARSGWCIIISQSHSNTNNSRILSSVDEAARGIGDESGFTPPISRLQETSNLLTPALRTAGYDGKVAFAIGPETLEFRNAAGNYYLDIKSKAKQREALAPSKLASLYGSVMGTFPVVLTST